MVRVEDYAGREQSYVKHVVLEQYLQRLAYKVGQFRPGITLNYIDGFSGPWKSGSGDLSDTSPFLAIRSLDEARANIAAGGKALGVRCLFVEKRKGAVEQLAPLRTRFPEVTVEAHAGEFEEMIPQAVHFATTGADPFAFVFIDPTGWSGYALDKITPLLRVKSCEVLVNFMTKDVIRFIERQDPPGLIQTFNDLFGSGRHSDEWKGLTGATREAGIVKTYCTRLGAAGRFAHCVSSVVANPLSDRTHFHLIYATRSLHGLVAFRDAEQKALDAQFVGRAAARQRDRVKRSGQAELFAAGDTAAPDAYLEALRTSHQEAARREVAERLSVSAAVAYDDLVAAALRHPMVRVTTLSEWLREWSQRGAVRFVGLDAKDKIPKVGRGHSVARSGQLS
jgi:three-Cys-motif partner protein